jgi:hypothetical protein
MIPGQIKMVYSHYDRLIVGGAVPVGIPLLLEAIDPLKSEYFLQRPQISSMVIYYMWMDVYWLQSESQMTKNDLPDINSHIQ